MKGFTKGQKHACRLARVPTRTLGALHHTHARGLALKHAVSEQERGQGGSSARPDGDGGAERTRKHSFSTRGAGRRAVAQMTACWSMQFDCGAAGGRGVVSERAPRRRGRREQAGRAYLYSACAIGSASSGGCRGKEPTPPPGAHGLEESRRRTKDR